MKVPIQVALMLKKSCRTAEAKSLVQQIVARLGMEPTRIGAATLSCRVSPSVFANLFGRVAKAIPARPPAATNHGAPRGHEGEDLPIPAELVSYVDLISVVPPATRLDRPVE